MVVTFKCSPKFKERVDEAAKHFDSRSLLIRKALHYFMGDLGYTGEIDEP